MFHIEETLYILPSYLVQRDFYVKAFVYAGGVLIFFDFLRAQISEVNILQLIPGFIFFLVIVSFFFLLTSSNVLIRIPFEMDKEITYGTKTTTKKIIMILGKFSFFIFSTGMLIVLNTLIPISLDFFNSTGEKTLENTWEFGEVLGLEIFLLFVLSLLFEIPVILIVGKYNEEKVKIFPKAWKLLSLMIFLLSGLITPTVDCYTQLSLAFAALSLYLIIITIFKKRLNIKSTNSVSLY
jgi:Sec-independent protein secretion pathway component TatC